MNRIPFPPVMSAIVSSSKQQFDSATISSLTPMSLLPTRGRHVILDGQERTSLSSMPFRVRLLAKVELWSCSYAYFKLDALWPAGWQQLL